MSVSRFFLTLATVVVLSVPALSQTEPVEVGGDVYVSDSTVTQPILAERDPIALGVTVALSSDVAEDVHAIGGDVVAAGASVSVDGTVAGDVAASAMTLRFGPRAKIGGNARWRQRLSQSKAPFAAHLWLRLERSS